METGTGKTYVYTRMMYELNDEIGLSKFIVVVPSLAIKAGSKSFMRSDYAKQHFSQFFPNKRLQVYEIKSGDFAKKNGRYQVSNDLVQFTSAMITDKNTIHVLLISDKGYLDKANYELTESLMNELSGKEDTSELIAIVKMKSNAENDIEMSENPIIALFDRPSNKGNLGTLLRSCDAFGVEKLMITGHCVDIYDPDVISASMGSFFKLPFIRLSDKVEIDSYIANLKLKYPLLKIIGTSVVAESAIYEVDMTNPVLLLIGNETNGLNRYYSEISDIIATIPMSEQSSASSFNVSCAATVVFYEASRQRYLNITH